MKTLLIALSLFSTSLMAQTWTETFKLPEGTTYRALMTGYDCGKFGTTYVGAPESVRAAKVEFKQFSADKDLNKILIEATYPAAEGQVCIYGGFLDRKREGKTLEFTHSLLKTSEGLEDYCLSGKEYLDTLLTSVSYEASKRGIRYVAVEILKDTPNDVCESRSVRAVFDRRLVP